MGGSFSWEKESSWERLVRRNEGFNQVGRKAAKTRAAKGTHWDLKGI